MVRALRTGSGMRTHGRSLIEMMVVLSLLVIMTTLAAAPWQAFLERQSREAAASTLISHLGLARSAAISRRARVTIAPREDLWRSGWRVFVDRNRDGEWEEGEAELLVSEGVDVDIEANGVMRRYVSFDELGRPVQANGAFLAGAFTLCKAGGQQAHRLVLAPSGRVRQEKADGLC